MDNPSSWSEQNIVLTGFMGTGKTTVGSLLAQRMVRPFVDMDERLEAHFGMPIADVFVGQGEAVFRRGNRELCRTLAQERGLVIATGGGALVDAENRAVLGQRGILICLTAEAMSLQRRLEAAVDRPLLPGSQDERRQRIEALLADRLAAYNQIAIQIPTDGRTPDEIVAAIVEKLDIPL